MHSPDPAVVYSFDGYDRGATGNRHMRIAHGKVMRRRRHAALGRILAAEIASDEVG